MLESLRSSFTPEDRRSLAILDESCRIVDGVHWVYDRALYTYSYEELPPGQSGIHMQGDYVVVSTRARHPLLASIHEIGHALDAVFLNSIQVGASVIEPPLEYASDMAEAAENAPQQGRSLLCGWWSAVRRSHHFQSLVDSLRESEITPAQAFEIEKLLKARELWARSYELFIARQSSARLIASQMDVECSDRVRIGSVVTHNYWQDADFSPVEAELWNLFEKIGWMRT